MKINNIKSLGAFSISNSGGGGGGGTVDQTYDSTSTNAQSGTAVAEAVAPALKNKATTQTGSDASLILFPWNEYSIAAKGSVFIGPNNGTIVTQGNHDTLVGAGPSANAANGDCTAVGYNAQAGGQGSTSIGSGSSAIGQYGISIGKDAKCNESGSVAIGLNATVSSGNNAIAIGNGAKTDQSGSYSGSYRIAIGTNAYATAYNAIAIGNGGTNNTSAKATNKDSIQLGVGINNTAKTLQVFEWPLLDGTTGKIPAERLPSVNNVEVTDTMPTPSSSNVGQVKLYSGTTTSNFTNGYLYQCKLESTLEETVTFDSDKISAPSEMFWLVVKVALPETYSNVTNGNVTYSESANLVTFTFKDANNNVLGQFPGDVGELSGVGFTFNNLTDGEVINFTCFSGMVESYEWTPLIVQESSEIKIYNAPSWSRNTTLFPNCRLSLPNIDDLTEPGMFRVKYTENDETGAMDLDYLCNVSPFNASGTIIGIFQSLQVIYPAVGIDSGINATLYRAKLSGGTWSDWKSSLVTSVSSNSTYSEYVSAKLFYDTCGNIEALINAL